MTGGSRGASLWCASIVAVVGAATRTDAQDLHSGTSSDAGPSLLLEIERATALESVAVRQLDGRVMGASGNASAPLEERHRVAEAWATATTARLFRPREAAAAWARVAELHEARGDAAGLARATLAEAEALEAAEALELAVAAYTRAQVACASCGDAAGELRASLGRHGVGGQLHRPDADEQLLAVVRRITKDSPLRGRALLLGSLTSTDQADSELAALMARDARAWFARRGCADEALAAATRQAECVMNGGDFRRAYVELTKLAADAERSPRRWLAARIAQLRAQTLMSLARIEEAGRAADVASAIYADLGIARGHLLALLTKTIGLLNQYRRDEASATMDQTADLLEGVSEPFLLAYHARCRAIAPPRDASTATVIALLERAMPLMTEAGFSAEHIWHLRVVRAARVAEDPARRAEAMAEYEAAAEFYREQGYMRGLRHALGQRGLLHASANQAAQAIADYLELFAILEDELSASALADGAETVRGLRENAGPTIENLLEFCAQSPAAAAPRAHEVYRAVQVMHGLTIRQALAERSAATAPPAPDAALAAQISAARTLLRGAIERYGALARRETRSLAPGAGPLAVARAEVEAQEERLVGLLTAARIAANLGPAGASPAANAGRAADVTAVQAGLPPGAALVEYVVDARRATAFVLTRDAVQLVPLGESEAIKNCAAAMVAVIAPTGRSSRLRGETRAALVRAGERLLTPVLAALPNGFALRSLLIAPNGPLCALPFEALLCADPGEGASESTWPFLVQRCAVAYVPSGSAMLSMRAARRSMPVSVGPEFVALAHPLYREQRLAPPDPQLSALRDVEHWGALVPLPEGATEVLAIARLLATGPQEEALLATGADRERCAARMIGARFALYLRDEANEHVLKTAAEVRNARVLHLACHGAADSQTPALSHLVLAQDHALAARTGEDGYVVLRELGELHLRAELLTLSACQTGAGKVEQFDGAVSLARAGLQAGAAAVLPTLWPVHDWAARDLMVAFYRGWLRDGLSRTEALARAKRAALRAGIDVADWAAFVLWDADARVR